MNNAGDAPEERREKIKQGLVADKSFSAIADETGLTVGVVAKVADALVEAGELEYTPASYRLPGASG